MRHVGGVERRWECGGGGTGAPSFPANTELDHVQSIRPFGFLSSQGFGCSTRQGSGDRYASRFTK